jgi:hypothetical protein
MQDDAGYDVARRAATTLLDTASMTPAATLNSTFSRPTLQERGSSAPPAGS